MRIIVCVLWTLIISGVMVAEDAPAVTRINNSAQPVSCTKHHLKELWRVGGETDTEGEVFGQINAVAVDVDGNAYILDRQFAEVRMFSPTGIYLRTLGRDGEGPGEFRQPLGLVVTPSGKIGVYQLSTIKLVLFDRSGTPAGDLRFELDPAYPIQYLQYVQCTGRYFLVSGVDFRNSEEGMDHVLSVMRFDAEGKFICELARTVRHFDFAKPIVRDDDRPPRAVLTTAGAAYVSASWNYEISCSQTNCAVEFTITRDYEHRRRTGEEMKRIESYYREGGGTQGAKLQISKYDPDIRWMAMDARDRLWVLTSRGCADLSQDSLAVFDIFDLSGKLVQQVELFGEGDFATDGYVLTGNRLFLLRHGRAAANSKLDDAEPMSVICYELPN